MFRSKISVSKSSSWAGSTWTPVGRSSSSSAVSMCNEAIVSMGYAYTRGEQKSILEVNDVNEGRVKTETTMGISRVVRVIDIDLFNKCFHVELLVEDDRAESKLVADVCSRVACKRGLSLGNGIHPIGEVRSGVALGMVPHTIVESGGPCRINSLSLANQQIVKVGIFGGKTWRSHKHGQWQERC
uniref:Uncharacterized protein n=1 Tax=Romanomermis culicivorax TaxID=13658 RepID=A0A915LAM6_ROMCU